MPLSILLNSIYRKDQYCKPNSSRSPGTLEVAPESQKDVAISITIIQISLHIAFLIQYYYNTSSLGTNVAANLFLEPSRTCCSIIAYLVLDVAVIASLLSPNIQVKYFLYCQLLSTLATLNLSPPASSIDELYTTLHLLFLVLKCYFSIGRSPFVFLLTSEFFRFLRSEYNRNYEQMETRRYICVAPVVMIGLMLPIIDYLKGIGGQKALSNAQEDGSKIIKVDNRVPLDSESFAAIISHELRTPIHGIINCIDMIQDTNLSPDQQCYVSIIQNCSQTLHSIINHVLHHSRLDSNSYNAVITSFPVCRVVQSVGETIEPVADKKGLSFILNVNTDSDDYCWVAGDENGLRQALINLAGNAVKFTSEGYVTISLDIDPPTPRSQVPENVLSLYPNLVADVFYSICFTVNDTGSGMSPSFTTRCFEPYAQELPPLHRSQGTGLGLSIVKKWVEANGGEVFIKSELHEGTMIGFRMWFPRGEGKFENLEELNLQNIVVGCVQSGNIVAKESNGELLTSEKTTIARPLIMDGIIAGLIKRHIKSAFLDAHLWLNSCHTCNCDRSFRRECYSVPDRQNLTFHESYLSPKFQPQNFPLSISQHFSVANPPSNHSSLNEPHHLDILIIEDNISLLRHFIHDPRVSFEKVLFIASVSTISSAYKEMLDLLSTDWKEGNGKVMIIAKPAVERKVVHALRDLRKGEGVVTVDENQTTAEPQGTIVTGKKENLISDMTKLNGLAGRNRNRLSELDDRLMDDLQVIDITSSSIQSHHTSQELIGLFKKQYRVLVVEDNPINATILCKHLCKNGFKVDTVTNGCEAVDKVKETLYSSDRSMSFYGLILMDIQMPIMDGIEATKRIRTLESSFMASTPVVPKTPSCCSTHQTLSESKLWFRPSTIVAFTGLSLLSDKEKAFQAGCQYFLNKPLRFHQLQETLDEAIRMRFSS